DLRPHIELDRFCAAVAAEGAARRPAIARIGPGDFLPVAIVATYTLRPYLLIGGNARQGAEHQRGNRNGDQAPHRSFSYGKPAMPRASPVSSRICRPVLARSTA